jgi:hypothetical protein
VTGTGWMGVEAVFPAAQRLCALAAQLPFVLKLQLTHRVARNVLSLFRSPHEYPDRRCVDEDAVVFTFANQLHVLW